MFSRNINMITASIVTYHHPNSEIGKVVDCILQSKVHRLYIIDNSANDALRSLEKISAKIRYIHNANIGYGGAHNIAIREAIENGAKYHVVINPDIYFFPGTIELLSDYMDQHQDVGQVMPKVLYPNGELQHLCKLLPTPMDLLFRRFLPDQFLNQRRSRFEMRFSGYNKEMNVPFLSGCFMFLRIDTLKETGLFDERFFMYGEDIDLCRRIHRKYKTMYYPQAIITHVHEAASYKNKKMLRIHICNIIKYFNKWGWIIDSERIKVNKAAIHSSMP